MGGVIHHARRGPAAGTVDAPGRPPAPLLAVCAGYFMVILEVTVINVAVPVVGRDLSASLTGIQWITDGYTLVFAGLLLTGGALGGRPAQCALIATVALLTTVLNEAGRRGWADPLILTGAGLCLLSAVAFVLRERLARTPVLPLRLLCSRPMSGVAAIGLLFNFAFYGMIFTASLSFQHHRGLSALRTGLALFPAVAMTMFASVLSGRLARRTGHRPLVVTGMLLGGRRPGSGLRPASRPGCGRAWPSAPLRI